MSTGGSGFLGPVFDGLNSLTNAVLSPFDALEGIFMGPKLPNVDTSPTPPPGAPDSGIANAQELAERNAKLKANTLSTRSGTSRTGPGGIAGGIRNSRPNTLLGL